MSKSQDKKLYFLKKKLSMALLDSLEICLAQNQGKLNSLVIAVSGGEDSIALLYLLNEI